MKILETYADEFCRYLSSGCAPFETLRDSHYKTIISSLLSDNDAIRGDLFGKENLDGSIAKVLGIMGRCCPLYNRWVQRVGSKERVLSVPKRNLENFLGYFGMFIRKLPVHERCRGGERDWTPRKSLEAHLPFQSAFSFDLMGAFENLRVEMVFGLIYNILDYLNPVERRNIAGFFSMICTVSYGDKRGLPQGAPTSMPLFNRILYPLDSILSEKAYERGFLYSRWVDDFTLTSFDKRDVREVFGVVDLVINELPIADHKIFFQDKEPIYLLGHKIVDDKVLKNSEEERLRCKVSPLNLNEVYSIDNCKDYKPWV